MLSSLDVPGDEHNLAGVDQPVGQERQRQVALEDPGPALTARELERVQHEGVEVGVVLGVPLPGVGRKGRSVLRIRRVRGPNVDDF